MNGEPLPHELPRNVPDAVAEELTAYLDGELDDTARAAVTARLASDAVYRARLQSLQTAWDLLDELPRTQPSETFARSTLEMAVVEAERTASGAASRSGWRGLLGAAALVLVALAVGYAFTAWSLARPNRQLARDLPVIDRIDAFRHVENVDYLRQLERAGLFAADETTLPSETSAAGEAVPLAAAADYEQLSPARREELQEEQGRFTALSSEQRERLRQVHAEWEQTSDAAALLGVAERYAEWLKTLSPSDRSLLLEMPTPQRLEKIAGLMKEQQVKQFHRLGYRKLSPADLDAIFSWLDEALVAREKELFDALPPEIQKRVEVAANPVQRRMMIAMATSRMNPTRMVPLLMPSSVQQLATRLSPEAQKELVAAGDERARSSLLRLWVHTAVVSRILPQVDTPKLRSFYSTELSAEQRERLDSLPREQFEQELRTLYFQHESHRWEGNSAGGSFVKPGGGMGPPGFRPRPKPGEEPRKFDPRRPGEPPPEFPPPGEPPPKRPPG